MECFKNKHDTVGKWLMWVGMNNNISYTYVDNNYNSVI